MDRQPPKPVKYGIQRIAILTEHVPIHDVMQIHAQAHEQGVTVLGPNSPGLVFPERSFLGILPAWEPRIFKRGSVGVVSRSGSLGTLACVNLVRAGLGQSAFFGIPKGVSCGLLERCQREYGRTTLEFSPTSAASSLSYSREPLVDGS